MGSGDQRINHSTSAAIAAVIALVIALVVSFLMRQSAGVAPPSQQDPGGSAARDEISGRLKTSEQQLSALRKDNQQLGERLTRLEAELKAQRQTTKASATQASATQRVVSQPDGAKQRVFDSPRAVVLAYLSAPSWQDRVLYVANAASMRARMQQAYEPVTLLGKQTALFEPDKWKRGKIRAPQPQPDGKLLVQVDMTGLAEEPLWEYFVVKEDGGYKVDWSASSERAKRNEWKLHDAVLEVQVLKIEQRADYAVMSFQVTNRSSAFVSFWSLAAAAYDADGKFLANDKTNGSNLQPQLSAVESIRYQNVQADRVASWKLKLDMLNVQKKNGDELPNAEPFFTLREVK